MLFKKAKNILSACPKTGKYPGHKRKYCWLIWVFPIVGLASLVWFLMRVIPKPSRATYPCQRVAAPLAGGFVIWIAGLLGSALAYRRARDMFRRSHLGKAAACFALAAALVIALVNIPQKPLVADEPQPNEPIGVARGIYPGRVVWAWDPNATDWEGYSSPEHWYDRYHTNLAVVEKMVSQAIRELAGKSTDAVAWDAIFRYFNENRGKGNIGYRLGEKIAIKINLTMCNDQWNSCDRETYFKKNPNLIDNSPQMILTLLRHLVETVGVDPCDISIGDPACRVPNYLWDILHPEFPNVHYLDNTGRFGRTRVEFSDVPFYWSTPDAAGKLQDYIPVSFAEADYIINFAILKGHSSGITVCAKNHYGSLIRCPNNYLRDVGFLNYYDMHVSLPNAQWTPGRGYYRALVDMMGHLELGGKTLLYLIDGLYAGYYADSRPHKWTSSPFGDEGSDWPSSLFASLDPVAIDSVAYDFLLEEWPDVVTGGTGKPGSLQGGAEDYLHEAALADDPPSGTFYDPEGDGTRLASLGVHEHWNNSTDKQYSRNLGTGEGIELVRPSLTSADGPVENATAGKRYDYIRHAIADADPSDEIVVGPGIYNENVNLSGKNLTVRSANPTDPAVVAATIISGGDRVVTFSGGEDASCVLAGFTITGANTGIYCSGASPTINTCRIAGNSGVGIELHDGSNPTVINCVIAANAGAGIQMWARTGGRTILYNYPEITNCTIAGNLQGGILGGILTITNSIIWANSPEQIAEASGIVSISYSDIQGGLEGEGNIDADPLFADPDSGDYHLKSQAGRWDPNSQTWVQDQVTSPCIDAGDASTPVGLEPFPNGGVVNMGAYGGTAEASKS